MCRLFGLVANKPVDTTFSMLEARLSLKQQSVQDGRGCHNPHGWGIGYYDGTEATVRKRPEEASESSRFSEVAQQAYSHMFVAHVRYRTAGQINMKNTQPFEADGWILAQNGGIGKPWHKRIRREVGRDKIRGRTSGEHLLMWLYQRAGHLEGVNQEERIISALRDLCAKPVGITSANFVLTTGERLYAFRFSPPGCKGNTLFFVDRLPMANSLLSTRTGLMLEAKWRKGERTVLVASDKMTEEEHWRPIENGCLLVADCRLRVRMEQICSE